MPANTPCLLVDSPGRVTLAHCTVPEPGPDDALIEVEVSGISPGTERREMAIYDEKRSKPFVPGYALVGRVTAAGPDHQDIVGQRVFAGGTRSVHPFQRRWGGHVGTAVAAIQQLVPLPDNVTAEAASLTKVAAIALHGVQLAKVTPHDKVIVVGLGVIGQCSARLAIAAGAKVWAIDTSVQRVDLARRTGVAAHAVEPQTVSELRRLTQGGADVVIDSTGVPSVLAQSTELLRETPWGDPEAEGPRLVVQGSFAADFRLNYDEIFKREAMVLVPRDNLHIDLVGVVDRLADGRLVTADLISTMIDASDAPSFYRRLHDDASVLTGCINWW